MFDKSVVVFESKGMVLGEFDPTVSGCYRNVKTFPFTVKPRKNIYVKVTSSGPVDVVVANSDSSMAAHKDAVTEVEIGPVPTGANKEMGIIMGVFAGDKVSVDIQIRMGR